MAETETIVWGIHGGRTGDVDSLFLKSDCVAVGWPRIGDLSKLGNNRDAFKHAVAAAYPDKKPNAIPNNAGQLYRFTYEMKPGHLVVYPSKADRNVHIGRISGPYKYEPTTEATYPNLRPVQWLKALPRTHFTQGALYEIGSAMSLFQVRTYADEFLAAVEGKASPSIIPVNTDETVAIVAEEIEETARDFVLKRLAQELKGHPLAEFVAHLLQAMGYRTRVSPEGPDGGVDVVAHKDELGFEPPIIKVQVKSTSAAIGDPVVASLYGKVSHGEFGLFVALGTFTAQARNFERGKSNLRLIDGDELVMLILQNYEQLDSRYKGLIPLRRVYVPEPIEANDE